MPEPPQDRSLTGLSPMFRAPFEAWLRRAQQEALHVRLFVTEGHRTEERQRWLFRQGREPPFENQPIVTNTMQSNHRWGLAADLAMQREDGTLIWAEDSWRWLYKVSQQEHFGLRHLDPFELVHLEYRWANEAIAEADTLGLVQS